MPTIPQVARRFAIPVLAAFTGLAAPATAQDHWDIRADVGLGGGHFTHHTHHSSLDGGTDTGFGRLDFEMSRDGTGFGGRLETFGTDDDLFGAPGAEAGGVDLFAFAQWSLRGEQLRMPVRFGLLFDDYQFDQPLLAETLSVGSLGLRLELEPQLTLVQQERLDWSLFANVNFGIAFSGIDSDQDNGHWSSSSTLFGAELGTRLRYRDVTFGLSFVHREQGMHDSDVDLGRSIAGFERRLDVILLTAGLRF